jgi:hypothetical protein
MSELKMTLFSEEELNDRTILRTDDENQKLDLAPTEDTLVRIRHIEDAFAMAEQSLGMLRAG